MATVRGGAYILGSRNHDLNLFDPKNVLPVIRSDSENVAPDAHSSPHRDYGACDGTAAPHPRGRRPSDCIPTLSRLSPNLGPTATDGMSVRRY